MTLVRCAKAFELYNTIELAQSMHSLTDNGETKTIIGVRNSLETGGSDSLTYLQDGKTVRQVSLVDNPFTGTEIKKTTIMNLSLKSGEVVSDVWVFDKLVAVRFTNKSFRFFQRPLVAGNYANALGYTFDEEEGDIDPAIVAYDFSIDDYSGKYDLFAVANVTMYRYRFTYDDFNQTISMDTSSSETSILDNSNVRMAVTRSNVIVTCGDCSTPAVTFFNRELDSIKSFSLDEQIGDVYNIAFNELYATKSLQVFIAGRDKIDLIQVQEDKRNEKVW